MGVAIIVTLAIFGMENPVTFILLHVQVGPHGVILDVKVVNVGMDSILEEMDNVFLFLKCALLHINGMVRSVLLKGIHVLKVLSCKEIIVCQ